MWRLLELSMPRVAVAIGWGVLSLGSGLALAALAAWLIARAWQMPPVLDLSIAVVAVRALGISRGLCRYVERLVTHDVALRSMTAARTTVYRTLARSNFWLYRPQALGGGCEPRTAHRGDRDRRVPPRRGDLLVRIGTDIDDLGAVVVRVFVPVAVAVVVSVAAVALSATISVAGAAILAGGLALSGIVAPWVSARTAATAQRAARADRAEFVARSVTILDHAAELRVAGRLDAAVLEATAASSRAAAAEDAVAARGAWSAAATPLSIGVSVLGALMIGITIFGAGGAEGAMTPMALFVLVLLPLSAFEAVGSLPAAAQALTIARAALHRLSELAEDSVVPDPATERPATLHPRTGPMPPLPPAVASFDELADRRRIALIGPSGAGKTTVLMKWAGMFDTPRPGVTFFAEDAHLFGTSVLENLRVARGDLTVAQAENAVRAVGLGRWLDGLPNGVHTDLIGGAAAVSGGQRRRLLLARALVSPARVLLLDEPTEHLEAHAGAQLLRDLLDIDSGLVERERTVVVVTHQLPDDHRADTVLRIGRSDQVTVR
ncbi:thiol reductant ABC exporter subunit CydC [Nocardia sp. CNY236]|uniref:thiol reductant ABC exporter subunit CydC n=1 Tax=Nocardia sp. CNY236 TaxID=1169152 RepID=UPI000563D833|nr:thiol reductant ABC exporter subunit CydC [Nocardia sp. CNY236]